MGGHFKTLCSSCGTVIAQCRCPGEKKVYYETCAVCKRRQRMVDDAVGMYLVKQEAWDAVPELKGKTRRPQPITARNPRTGRVTLAFPFHWWDPEDLEEVGVEGLYDKAVEGLAQQEDKKFQSYADPDFLPKPLLASPFMQWDGPNSPYRNDPVLKPAMQAHADVPMELKKDIEPTRIPTMSMGCKVPCCDSRSPRTKDNQSYGCELLEKHPGRHSALNGEVLWDDEGLYERVRYECAHGVDIRECRLCAMAAMDPVHRRRKEIEKQLIDGLKKTAEENFVGDTLKIINPETEPVARVLTSSWSLSEDEIADFDTYPPGQDHVQSLTTRDRDDNPIPPTCAYCGRVAERCEGVRDEEPR
jgi:hypothetical protein